MERWANGGAKLGPKYSCVVQKVTNAHQVKVNGTHVHAVYEKIEVLLFQVCCRRINIFLNDFNFTYTM